MPELCNHVVNLVFAALSPDAIEFNVDLVTVAFDESKGKRADPLRKLLGEATVIGNINVHEHFVPLIATPWPLCLEKFLLDVTARTKELASKGLYPATPAAYWVTQDLCKFHKHDDRLATLSSGGLTDEMVVMIVTDLEKRRVDFAEPVFGTDEPGRSTEKGKKSKKSNQTNKRKGRGPAQVPPSSQSEWLPAKELRSTDTGNSRGGHSTWTLKEMLSVDAEKSEWG